MRRYEGRVAVVTGAAQGIGAGAATRLAEEGAAVALVDLQADRVEETAESLRAGGARAVAVGADVSRREDVERAIGEVVAELGRIDVLVNNAGVIRDNLLHRMSDEDWDLVLNVHLRGAFLCSQAAAQHMVEQRYGRIVNLSSTGADGTRGQANYSAAKAGMRGFTKTLALELGKFGITANSVAPGFVSTAMTQQTADRIGMSFDDFVAGAAEQIPVRRVGEPADIAAAIAFLASEEAGYITGQVLTVDGGGRI